jgi:hypothetical protein
MNQCWFRHSRRTLALKLSMKALSVGFPGRLKSRMTPFAYRTFEPTAGALRIELYELPARSLKSEVIRCRSIALRNPIKIADQAFLFTRYQQAVQKLFASDAEWTMSRDPQSLPCTHHTELARPIGQSDSDVACYAAGRRALRQRPPAHRPAGGGQSRRDDRFA